jgi:hypothetical protein
MVSAASAEPRAPTRRAEAWFENPGAPYACLAGLMLLAFAVLLYASRDIGFNYDEWDFVLHRRANTLDVLLTPNNEHLSLVPVLVYKVLFKAVGFGSHLPYEIAVLVFHLACAGLLFTYARPRIGPWAALIPTALLLFLGAAWQDLLWPFQIGFFASLAFGLAALIALDRERDRWVTAWLLLSICSSGVGLPIAAGIALRLLLTRPRALWVPLIPVALWFVWSLKYGDSHLTKDALLKTPQWTLDAAASAVAGLGGLGAEWGRLGLLALIVAFTVTLSRFRERAPVILGLAAIPVGFWLLTAASRALTVPPDTSRYIYVGSFWVLVLAVELAAGLRATRGQAIAATLVAVFLVAGSMAPLQAGSRSLRQVTTTVAADLTALTIARDSVSAELRPAPELAPQVDAGHYIALVNSEGTAAYSESDLAEKSDAIRQETDAALLRYEGAALVPMRHLELGETPVVGAVNGPSPQTLAHCLRSRTVAPASYTEVLLPAGGLRITAGRAVVSVSLRRFSPPQGGVPLGVVQPRKTLRFKLPYDRSGRPWFVRFSSETSTEVCGVR